jgi:hypothetical protein
MANKEGAVMGIILFNIIVPAVLFIIFLTIIKSMSNKKEKQKSFYDFLENNNIGSWNSFFCCLIEKVKRIKEPLEWRYEESGNYFVADLDKASYEDNYFISYTHKVDVIKYKEENNKKIFIPSYDTVHGTKVTKEENEILNEKFNTWMKDMKPYFDRYDNYLTNKKLEKINKRINLLK